MGNNPLYINSTGIRHLAVHSSNVKKDVDKEGIEILDDMTIPAVN